MDTSRHGTAIWSAWVGANALGEGVGLGVAFIAGAALHDGIGESGAFLLSVLALGTLEGVILGALQALVLRRALPTVGMGRWVVATALGALVGAVHGLVLMRFVAEVPSGVGPRGAPLPCPDGPD